MTSKLFILGACCFPKLSSSRMDSDGTTELLETVVHALLCILNQKLGIYFGDAASTAVKYARW